MILLPSGRDDTDMLQRAIDELPPTGGILLLGRGVFLISRPLIIGNGDMNRESTRHGVSIRGEGAGPGPLATLVGAPTSIRWIGGPAPYMIVFMGPVCGVGLQDLQLDGAGVAGGFMALLHVAQSVFRDVSCTSYTKLGLYCTTVRQGMAYGSSGNCFDNVMITDPQTPEASGAWFNGGVPGLDTCSTTWTGGALIYGGRRDSFGLKLEGADNNAWWRTNIMSFNAALYGRDIGPSVLCERWTHDRSFPIENTLFACSMSTTPEGAGTFGNFFLPLQEGDLFKSGPLPAGVGGIGTRRGIFGAMQPRAALPDAHSPILSVTSTNGAHNGCGAIGFYRAGMHGDELRGVLFVDFFGGLYFWDGETMPRKVLTA